MINFSKEQLNKLVNLNEEYINTSSQERRKEIEQEIIAMVPKEDYAGGIEIAEMSKLQAELKEKINALGACATKGDFEVFFKHIDELDEKICAHAKQLGTELKRTDYGQMMAKMLELKFGGKAK